MYKYEYVKISANFSGWGPINGKIWETEDYHEIVDQKVQEGYRLVGFVPTKQRYPGHTEEIELIFEKKEEK